MSISAAESVVMEALWRRHPLSAEDIAAEVAGEQEWTEATVKTLLNRLLTKGAVSAARDGRRYLYSPVLARADYVSAESRGLLDRLFDGRALLPRHALLRARALERRRNRRTETPHRGARQ